MEEYEVKLTPYAENALREIGLYISQILQAPQSAIPIVSLIYKEIKSLCIMPARFPIVLEEPLESEKIHKMTVKNYIVYYLIYEERKIVQIIDILYARRDQKTQLLQIDTDFSSKK